MAEVLQPPSLGFLLCKVGTAPLIWCPCPLVAGLLLLYVCVIARFAFCLLPVGPEPHQQSPSTSDRCPLKPLWVKRAMIQRGLKLDVPALGGLLLFVLR